MLMPKRVKYRKAQRGRMRGKAQRGSTLAFGEYGLKALEPGWITNRQIEAARVALTRSLKRGGKVWIRIFPDKPVTKKPAETRMGKGKGNPEEWVAVIKVHLKGTFAPSRHTAACWRERAKAGETNDARIINTTSVSGIYGNPGQTNYGAAKMGIAAFTIISSLELERYGVTVNAIAPGALTRLTEDLGMGQASEETK